METIREATILDYLKKHRVATHEQLCQENFCSLSTLRRDLIRLEKNHLVRRVRGGVVLNDRKNLEYSNTYREKVNTFPKKIIGELAADFITPGMCLFLDSSSTVQHIIPYLKDIPNLIVVTNGLKSALLLSELGNGTIKVYITGGEVKLNTSSVISNHEDQIVNSFRFNVAFFSCGGLDSDGIYEASFSQAQVKKNMMKKATKKILLADDSKLETLHFFKIGDFSDYDALVTNKKTNLTYSNLCEKNNIELVYPL